MSEIKLKRSSVLESGSAKAPTAGQLTHGELALNFADSDPTIFYKDSNNDIREIKLALQPDLTIGTAQPGTLDDRYLRLSGGTLTGDLIGTSFQGGVVTISATAPTSGQQEGQLWYNTTDGRLYVYYTDADSSQWVDAAPDTLETAFTNIEANKLAGIEAGAQVNTVTSVNGQTGAVTVAGNTDLSYAPTTRQLASSTGSGVVLPEVVAGGNSGLMTGAAQSKLDGVEAGATGDQTGAEIKAAYELEANAFTDTLFTKLDAIEAGAQVNTVTSVNGQTGAVTVDGNTDLSYTASTRELASSTGNNVTLPEVVAGGDSGLMTGADKDILDLHDESLNSLYIKADSGDADFGFGNADELLLLGGTGITTVGTGATGRRIDIELDAATQTKLNGIEDNATADQTGAEIKSLYEAEADTNAFTDAEQTKLAGIADGATVSQWNTNGSDINYTTGNVGIGIASPDEHLHVSSSAVAEVKISSTDTTNSGILRLQEDQQFIIGYGTDHATQPNELSLKNNNDDITFYTNSTERVRITDGGLVGFGLDNPTRRLHIHSTTDSEPAYVQFTNQTTGNGATNQGGIVGMNGSEKMVLWNYYATGEIAFGTNGTNRGGFAADGTFNISGASNFSGDANFTSTATPVTTNAILLNNTENDGTYYTEANGILAFDENFDNDDNYGTGTYTPKGVFTGGDGGGLLIKNEDGWGGVFTTTNSRWASAEWFDLRIGSNQVHHDGRNGINIFTNTSGSGSGSIGSGAAIAKFIGDSDALEIRNIGDGDYAITNSQQDNGIAIYDGTGGVKIYYDDTLRLTADSGGIDVTGALVATGNVTAFSDINLKKNIEVIPNALEKVGQIRGVTFDRTDEELRQAGVIAQEVEQVLPEVVITDEDTGIKSVAYGNLVSLLIEAVKELKAEVEALKTGGY